MGVVYRAEDERLTRGVVVKILRAHLAGDPRFVERFRREARAVASLSHPNIAGIFDYGEDAGQHYIVMEFAEGRDLAEVIRADGRLSPQRAARITAQICVALDHAHEAGIIHRDIKPANVIVTGEDKVKVTDFGIARAVGDSTLTATGSMLGTASYLSPEQAGGANVVPASDIYSVGIVLYEMLTGAVPFTAESAVAVAMRHVNDDMPPPSSINPDVSPEMDAVVARATAKDPSDRWTNGGDMAAAVAAAVDPGAIPTDPGTTMVDGEVEPTVWPIAGNRWDPERLGRRVLITFAALALLAIVLLGVKVLAGGDEPTRGGRADPVEQTPTPSPTPSPEETTPPPPTAVEIPFDIIGMRDKDAEALLKELGLFPHKEDVPDDAEKHTVVGSDPEPGSEVVSGSEITLYVSDGKGFPGDEGGPPGNDRGFGFGDEDHDD